MRLISMLGSLAGTAFLLVLSIARPARAELHYGLIWYSPAPNDEIRRLAAERYEVGVTGLSSGEDRLAIKQMNPYFRWFVYISGTDDYVPPHPGGTPEHDAFRDLALRSGIDPEEAYLHYWDDTVIRIQGKVLRIPGWGKGSATEPSEARVPVYYSNLSRRAKNFSTSRARQIHKQVAINTRLASPFPETVLYADGIFLDNASGRLFNRGELLSGGRIRETPEHVSTNSEAFRSWYFDNFTRFMSELKDTLETSRAWSPDGRRKELMANIANVWDDAYVDRDVADILLLEFLYNPVRNCGADAVEKAFQRDAQAAAAGITSFYTAGMTRNVDGHDGEFDTGQVMLGNLAWYLLSRSPTTLFYQQATNTPSTAGWDTLTWRGVMDVAKSQLGEAQGPPFTIATGTDPLGNRYAVQARQYAGGLVLLRNRGSYQEGVEPATAAWVDLPNPLAPVSPSGTISPVVNRIALRNGEGAILLGDARRVHPE